MPAPAPITGTAAGVPYTALPPGTDAPAPLVICWHMVDAPRSDAALAAALPLSEVPAWRVYLGLPWCGARMPGGTMDELIGRAQRDPVLAYFHPLVQQAAAEFPAALAAVREQLPVTDDPVSLVGGSAGGSVALLTLARNEIPVRAAAVINPAIRLRTVIPIIEQWQDFRYDWTAEANAAADELDFLARAEELAARDPQPPLLVVSGAEDLPGFGADADALVGALRSRYADPELVRLARIPGLGHPLAEEPGIEPAPQLPMAKVVEQEVASWLVAHRGDRT